MSEFFKASPLAVDPNMSTYAWGSLSLMIDSILWNISTLSITSSLLNDAQFMKSIISEWKYIFCWVIYFVIELIHGGIYYKFYYTLSKYSLCYYSSLVSSESYLSNSTLLNYKFPAVNIVIVGIGTNSALKSNLEVYLFILYYLV